jgi:hypothetical protein
MAGSVRPPERKSRVAISLAKTVGFRSGKARTLVPNLSFLVRAATKDRATIGSTLSCEETIRSLSQRESIPSASQAST